MFNDLVFSEIEGLGDFAGTCFHSAQWDWSHDITGESVGVSGSAASAIQLVPEIVKRAGQVHLFQRTANWVLPKEDDPFSGEQLAHFRAHPEEAVRLRNEIYESVDGGKAFKDPQIIAEMEAAGLGNIAVVRDPKLRKKLTPDHAWGCKRPLFSNDYCLAFNRDDLELVTEPIERITRAAVVTSDGRERRVVTQSPHSMTAFKQEIDAADPEVCQVAPR